MPPGPVSPQAFSAIRLDTEATLAQPHAQEGRARSTTSRQDALGPHRMDAVWPFSQAVAHSAVQEISPRALEGIR